MSSLTSSKKRPAAGLIERLAALPRQAQHISTITISEIVYGAWKSGRPQHHVRNLEEVLLPAITILSFDSKAAYLCGMLRHNLEASGTPLALADLEIAAIAMANDLTLLSGNVRHFSRVPGLRLENWLE